MAVRNTYRLKPSVRDRVAYQFEKRKMSHWIDKTPEVLFKCTYEYSGGHFRAFVVPLDSLRHGTIPAEYRGMGHDAFRVSIPSHRFKSLLLPTLRPSIRVNRGYKRIQFSKCPLANGYTLYTLTLFVVDVTFWTRK